MREEISISGSAKSSFRQQETSLSRARESLILGLVDSSYSVWWWDGSFVAFLFRPLLKSLSDFTELFWTLFYLMLRLLNRFPRFRYFVCYVDMFCPMTWYNSVKEHVRDLRWILFVYLAIYMCFLVIFSSALAVEALGTKLLFVVPEPSLVLTCW